MQWIAPAEKDAANATLEKRLWDAADQFRANSGLKAAEYSGPILGLIFLGFADVRFAKQRAKLEKAGASGRRTSRVDDPAAYDADNILYLTPNARFDFLLNLPESKDIGGKVNDAMRDIEKHNSKLAGVLPKTYNLFTSTLLKELLKKISEIPATLDYDAFGRAARRHGPAHVVADFHAEETPESTGTWLGDGVGVGRSVRPEWDTSDGRRRAMLSSCPGCAWRLND